MKKSYAKDVQLLMKILQNQVKMAKAIETFNCNQNNLDQNEMAFDLCAFYMSQIGEAAKLLTDKTKKSFNYFNADCTKYFRNIVDHVYEKVNKGYLKAFVFSMISKEAVNEIKNRIKYCNEHAKSSNTN